MILLVLKLEPKMVFVSWICYIFGLMGQAPSQLYNHDECIAVIELSFTVMHLYQTRERCMHGNTGASRYTPTKVQQGSGYDPDIRSQDVFRVTTRSSPISWLIQACIPDMCNRACRTYLTEGIIAAKKWSHYPLYCTCTMLGKINNGLTIKIIICQPQSQIKISHWSKSNPQVKS